MNIQYFLLPPSISSWGSHTVSREAATSAALTHSHVILFASYAGREGLGTGSQESYSDETAFGILSAVENLISAIFGGLNWFGGTNSALLERRETQKFRCKVETIV